MMTQLPVSTKKTRTLMLLAAGLACLCALNLALGQTIGAASSAPAQKPITVGKSIILGVVEGLTEYLPVSSTGHLILTSKWLGLASGDGMESEAVSAFEIVIQLGAILAVVGLYSRRVGQMALGVVGKSREGLRLVILLFVAFLPAAIIGLKFHKQIKAHLFAPMPVVLALAVGGVLMILADWYRRTHQTNRTTNLDFMTLTQGLAIGLAQVLAMWPGTSRSMITIVAGLVVGLDILTAAEFSFLLALPTLGAATLYETYKSGDAMLLQAGWASIIVGLVVSCIVAAAAVKFFVHWLTKHGLTPFGIYRIALAIVAYLSLC